MAKSNNQKGKILYLERILQDSGENHTISMQEILNILAEKGVTAERKSIYDDLAVLREFGMDIRYRRGKPGGYYLAGQTVQAEAAIPPEKETAPAQSRSAAGERTPTWLGGAPGGRQIKLVCENSIRSRVEEAFGENGLYKEKGSTMFTVTAEISETPEFYGWLTSMGRSIYIQKPKKTAAAYRDYLKDLARGYKGV